ncbi:TlpA family protein disulfide reductase [Pleionea sediminis]|uniref:TlpA family protein disulfide reductase n=1 Tax=Pleionea sediminis TaxID=2569479 RepID=UPI0011869E23|nr:redoxin domain-containing protein [Pleionea sediminis]
MNPNKPEQTSAKTGRPTKRWLRWYDLLILATVIITAHYWQTRDSLNTSGTLIAPSFTLPTLDGAIIDTTQQVNVPTVFYFFAPWCSVCDWSIDNLNTLQNDIQANKINVYVVALDWRTKEEVESFMAERNLPVPVILGTQQQTLDFQIKGFPTYYIADENNVLRWASVGYSSGIGIQARLKLLDLM